MERSLIRAGARNRSRRPLCLRARHPCTLRGLGTWAVACPWKARSHRSSASGLVDLCLSARAHPALGDQLLDELRILFGPDGCFAPGSLALQERILVVAAPLAIDPPAVQGVLQRVGNEQRCGLGGALLGFEQPHPVADFFVFVQPSTLCVDILVDQWVVVVHSNYCRYRLRFDATTTCEIFLR